VCNVAKAKNNTKKVIGEEKETFVSLEILGLGNIFLFSLSLTRSHSGERKTKELNACCGLKIGMLNNLKQ
jgi:hypothetical protein